MGEGQVGLAGTGFGCEKSLRISERNENAMNLVGMTRLLYFTIYVYSSGVFLVGSVVFE